MRPSAQSLTKAWAVAAMDDWRDTFHRIIEKGIARGEVRAGVDWDSVATLFISMLEGGGDDEQAV